MGRDDPSWDKTSLPPFALSQLRAPPRLHGPSICGHLSRSFPVYHPETVCDSRNKGGPPRPSSEQHANKYSSQCLSNVTVSHRPILPAMVQSSCWLQICAFCLGASVAFTSLPRGLSLSPLSAASHFPKRPGTHLSTTLSFVPGNKYIFWRQKRHGPGGRGVTSSLT